MCTPLFLAVPRNLQETSRTLASPLLDSRDRVDTDNDNDDNDNDCAANGEKAGVSVGKMMLAIINDVHLNDLFDLIIFLIHLDSSKTMSLVSLL